VAGLVTSLLIVALAGEAPIEGHYPDATRCFACTFDQNIDRNYDNWPDLWTRRRGPGFPHYVNVGIVDERSPRGSRSLKVELDGGGAVAYSPPIAFSNLVDWVLESAVKTEGLHHDEAFLSLTMLDEKQRPLGTFESPRLGGTRGWTTLRLGPVSPTDPQAKFVLIGLHLQPPGTVGAADLKGSAWFADLWLGRLPRLTLGTGRPANLYPAGTSPTITCTTSGVAERMFDVQFVVEDALGRRLLDDQKVVQAEQLLTQAAPTGNQLADLQRCFAGTVQWEPKLPGPGFYRIKAGVARGGGARLERAVTLAVIEPRHSAIEGEFGWSLPQGNSPLPLDVLAGLISEAGIHWVKYPLWFPAKDLTTRLEQFVAFQEQLRLLGMEVVGLLNPPAARSIAGFGLPQPVRTAAADAFSGDPQTWAVPLEPILTRLGPQIRWWQLGNDADHSFVDYPQLAEKIAAIKTRLGNTGVDLNLGFGWSWNHQWPLSGKQRSPWHFLSLSADPPLTHDELETYLGAPAPPQTQRWVIVEPLPRESYSLPTRAIDLVQRMMTAKIAGAEAIFAADPFDPQRGLMNPDGSLGELFLAWRTTAMLLSGAKYCGSLRLPGGSPNHVFLRGDQSTMIVWNETPQTEMLYLGEKVRQIDVWGSCRELPATPYGQTIDAGPVPTFVTGLQGPVAQWRMDFVLDQERLPSISDHAHPNVCRWRNTFPQRVDGRVTLVPPNNWLIEPRSFSFRLEAGEELRHPLQITLPGNVTGGEHTLRAEFDIQADQPYHFSAYRTVQVGATDVSMEIITRLNADGALEVEQRFINQSHSKVNFRCFLYVPQRPRQKVDVVNLGPGRLVHVYILPDGKSLLQQQLWVRAEEIGGPRVLNYRFKVEP